MNNFTRKLSTLVCTLMLVSMLSACSDEPELDKQTKLLQTIEKMELAIEKKSVDQFMTHVSDDFKSQQRGWQKKDAERLLRLRLMRNKTIHIHQGVKRIDWLNEGDAQAEAEVVVAMAGTNFSLSDLPTFRGDMAKFIVTFQLQDGEYVVTQAEWQRANPADFVL